MFNLLFFALLVYRHFDNTNRTGGGVGKGGGGGATSFRFNSAAFGLGEDRGWAKITGSYRL